MILSFEFQCKITTFLSNIQKSRAEKELFYLFPLYIVYFPIMLYVENAILNDLCALYIVTWYIYREVFCSLPFLKTYGHIANSKRLSQAGRVVYCAYTGIRIRTIESFVEKNYAVVAIEHQIAGVDCAGLVRGGGKRGGQVMVFLIAVQFVHRDGKGQKGSKSLAGFGICKRGGKGLRTDDDVNRCLCHKVHCAQRKNKYKQSFHFLSFTFSHFECKITAFLRHGQTQITRITTNFAEIAEKYHF